MSDEIKVMKRSNMDVLVAYNKIPYALINQEMEGNAQDLLSELTEICGYYKIYNEGANFDVEGSRGQYIPAQLHYKLCASLINKEARFLFATSPDIAVKAKADAGKVTESEKETIDNYNDLVQTVLRANNFEDSLVKAAKDCFVGKRVGCIVNFNEDDGVTISFIPSTQFIYETKVGNPNVLTKFVCFIVVKNSREAKTKRIFKKKLVLEQDGYVWVEEKLYDGAGREVEEVTPYQQTKLKKINAVVFVNDGLTGDDDGESEIEQLKDYESWFSKLANADIDSERKNMNPVVYTVDMDGFSTKGLSRSAGSFWDLASDGNKDNASPQVGTIESDMGYSEALKTSLERIKTAGFEQVDVPNVNMETMVGSITSGKALKAVYWPLIVRCSEKMKMWGPKLRDMVETIIEGAKLYPNCISEYVNLPLVPVEYTVTVEGNIPIPEDEAEEKQIDLAEVESKVMSRKTYMKKWHGMSDAEVELELEQIAKERQIIDDAGFPGTEPYNLNNTGFDDTTTNS